MPGVVASSPRGSATSLARRSVASGLPIAWSGAERIVLSSASRPESTASIPPSDSWRHPVADAHLAAVKGLPSSQLGAGWGQRAVTTPMNWPRPTGVLPTATVAVTALVAVSITDTSWSAALATKTRAPAGSTATPKGFRPTRTRPTRRWLAASRTDTTSSFTFDTYALIPDGWMATAYGFCPAGTVTSTVLLAVPITDSVASAKFAASTRLPDGSTAMPSGCEPTGTVAATVSLAVSTTDTVSLRRLVT